MEFKQLRSFAAVVKWRSFTKAAEYTGAAQPTISTHIRQLEQELGVQLVARTTKNVDITPKGLELYEYAATILGLQERIAACCAEEKRLIYLGASTIPAAYLLPELLAAFSARYPDVRYVIRQDDSLGVIHGLMDGIFDVGFTGMNSEADELTCIPLCQDRMVLITPVNEHFLALSRKEPPDAGELLAAPIILRERGSGSKKTADSLLEKLGVSEQDLHVVARVNDQETIKNLVAGGLGISILSERAASNFVQENRVLMFDLPEVDSSRSLYLAYRRSCVPSSHVRALMDFAREFYGV